MSDKLIVVADSEADGFLDTATTVWCVSAKNYLTGEWYRFGPDDMDEFVKWGKTVDHWIGNYFLSYDAPLFKKVLGFHIPTSKITDTVIVSRLQKFTREGGHSLENWGRILKFPKGDFTDFSSYSKKMHDYCDNDVELNYKVICYLRSEGKKYGSHEAERIEHSVQYLLDRQKDYGFPLHVEKASKLKAELDNKANIIEAALQDALPPAPKWTDSIIPKYKKDGVLSIVGLKFLSDDWVNVSGPFSRIDWREFDTNSPKQKVERLSGYWDPIIRTKGYRTLTQKLRSKEIDQVEFDKREPYTWKLCEENFATIHKDAPKSLRNLGELAMLRARSNEIKGWFDGLGEDENVHGSCQSVGSITHRMAHRGPNLGNTASVDSPYGADCRACFHQGPDPDRYALLGTDASGIQLRVLAHYMNDDDYTHQVLDGDIHTTNLFAMGIDKGKWNAEKEQWSARGVAKTFIYAWLLGAGNEKVGLIIGGTPEEGRLVKETFLENIPALKRLKEEAAIAARSGRLVCLDGRHIEIKSAHYALSVYLQGGESCIMKKAMILWHQWAHQKKMDFQQLGVIHDEFQTRVLRDQAEELGELQVRAIVEAGKHFKTNCPMDGEYRIGNNWLDTH